MTDTIKLPKSSTKRLVKIKIDNQKGGTNTLLDETRLNLQQASKTLNLIQVQDSIWRTRWGTWVYGSEISGETSIVGGCQYVKDDTDKTRELIVVGGSGTVYKSTDNGSTWSSISGATMTAGKKCFFLQVGYELWITNKTDKLTIYDGTNLVKNTQISAPTGLSVTRQAGLSSGNYTIYAVVVALNDVGFTNASSEVSITVNKPRNEWSGTTEGLDFSWTAVSGATRYEIYMEDESGAEIYLDGTTTNSYSDDGSKELNPYVEAPAANTTGGPVLGKLTFSNGRVWGVDEENEQIVYSGTGQYQKYFSWYYGGGSIELEKGSGESPEAIVHYRTGKGTPIATAFTSAPNGRGSIWQVAFDSITIGSETVIIPTATKIVGSIGSNSADAISQARDNIFFTNEQGVFALKNRAQLFNVLSTDEQSVNIRPDYLALINNENMVAYYTQGKIFYSGNTKTADNNDIVFIYDTEHRNWNWYWDIGFTQFFEYTDTNGYTKFLGIQSNSNELVEISERYDTDNGTAIKTSWLSGLYHINPQDHSDFAKISGVLVELGNAKGRITIELLGVQKNKSLSVIASKTITDTASNNAVDFANDLFGDYEFSYDPEVPTSLLQSITKKRLKVRKLLNQIQYRISSTEAGAQYTLLSIMAKGKIIPTRPPSVWNE